MQGFGYRRDEGRVNAAAQEHAEIHIHVSLAANRSAERFVKGVERRRLFRRLDISPAPVTLASDLRAIQHNHLAGRDLSDSRKRRVRGREDSKLQVLSQTAL